MVESIDSGSSRRLEPEHPKDSESTESDDATLGVWDSFALLTNNMTGPGMMGLPLLFQQAGIIPSVLAIVFISTCSALCGTMLSETLSLIPGNSKFERKIEYTGAFEMFIGGRWFRQVIAIEVQEIVEVTLSE